jgi:RNA polymerase sigma-B factor
VSNVDVEEGQLTALERLVKEEVSVVPLTLVEQSAEPTAQHGSPDALIEAHISVARSLAARYRNRGIDLDDLEQVALLGLTKAAHRFRPDAGHDFLSYAVPTVRGEIRRYFRDHGWMVRPPRRVQELQARIAGAQDVLVAELGRSPRPSEIADHLDVGLADVEESLAAGACFTPYSLDVPARDDSRSWGDVLPGSDLPTGQVEARVVVAPMVRRLSERDRQILRLRFRDELTQKEIADAVGLTQAQVSRVLTRVLAEMRASLTGRSPAA